MPPLSVPAAWTAPLPHARPPAGMAIQHLPTGTYQTRAALAVQGGAFRDKRQFAASSILVRHPDGDLLIDTGFGSDVGAHIGMLPRFVRPPYQAARTVREQLDTAGHDLRRLRGILLTHAHWDHASGLDSLHGVPLWMNSDELGHAAADPGGKVFRTVSQGYEIHEYAFEDGPYLGFPASHDVYGDGSVVVVHAGGHTTGSVIVFVTVPGGDRYAFIGDLTWQIDGIHRRVERPWLMSRLADSDRGRLRQDLARMIALDGLMRIVPAHDLGSYRGIPLLTDGGAGRPR